MNKRTLTWILVGIGVLVISAALVFTVLFLFIKDKPSADQTALKPDTSKDFGACDLVEKSFIKSTLGEPADNLHGPNNMGLIHLGIGTGKNPEAQKCVYSFIGEGTMDNSFHASNGLSIEVYAHPDQADSDNTNKIYLDDGKEQIADLGDAAYFEKTSSETAKDGSALDGPAQKDIVKNSVYILTVFSGTKHYTFTLSQPTTESSFDRVTALAALKSLAESADLSGL